MTNQEKIEAIEQAQELVREAQQLVDEAMRGDVNNSNYQASGKYGFSQLLGNGNPYDASLNTLLENLEDAG